MKEINKLALSTRVANIKSFGRPTGSQSVFKDLISSCLNHYSGACRCTQIILNACYNKYLNKQLNYYLNPFYTDILILLQILFMIVFQNNTVSEDSNKF